MPFDPNPPRTFRGMSRNRIQRQPGYRRLDHMGRKRIHQKIRNRDRYARYGFEGRPGDWTYHWHKVAREIWQLLGEPWEIFK